MSSSSRFAGKAAPLFSGPGALRTGAGLVTIATPTCAASRAAARKYMSESLESTDEARCFQQPRGNSFEKS